MLAHIEGGTYGPWREEVTGDCIMKSFITLYIPHQNLFRQSNEE